MTRFKIKALVLLASIGLFAVVVWAACNKENSHSSDRNGSNCKVYLSFEMESTTSARTVNRSDSAELSLIDQTMALPHRERYAVEACYKNDGQNGVLKTMTMTVLQPRNPINYPVNAADGYIKPDYHHLVVENEVVSYYDQNNQLIRFAGIEGDAAAVQKILDAAANRQPLTKAEFEQGLNIMRYSGMLVQHHPNDLASIRLNNPDGSHCVQILDKNTQTAVGNFYFDASGVLQSRSMLKFEGTAQQPVLKNTYFEARYQSVVGEIPMWVQRFSTIDNFSITIQ